MVAGSFQSDISTRTIISNSQEGSLPMAGVLTRLDLALKEKRERPSGSIAGSIARGASSRGNGLLELTHN